MKFGVLKGLVAVVIFGLLSMLSVSAQVPDVQGRCVSGCGGGSGTYDSARERRIAANHRRYAKELGYFNEVKHRWDAGRRKGASLSKAGQKAQKKGDCTAAKDYFQREVAAFNVDLTPRGSVTSADLTSKLTGYGYGQQNLLRIARERVANVSSQCVQGREGLEKAAARQKKEQEKQRKQKEKEQLKAQKKQEKERLEAEKHQKKQKASLAQSTTPVVRPALASTATNSLTNVSSVSGTGSASVAKPVAPTQSSPVPAATASVDSAQLGAHKPIQPVQGSAMQQLQAAAATVPEGAPEVVGRKCMAQGAPGNWVSCGTPGATGAATGGIPASLAKNPKALQQYQQMEANYTQKQQQYDDLNKQLAQVKHDMATNSGNTAALANQFNALSSQQVQVHAQMADEKDKMVGFLVSFDEEDKKSGGAENQKSNQK